MQSWPLHKTNHHFSDKAPELPNQPRADCQAAATRLRSLSPLKDTKHCLIRRGQTPSSTRRFGSIRPYMASEPNEPAAADLSPSPEQPSMSSADDSAAAPAAAPTTPQLQRTQTDASLRSCFICLQTPSETPNAAWVNACPCSLEAHEDCMLRWISEHERESTKTLRCPACKGKIQTTEPKDSFVGLRDRLHKMYSRITPAILLGVVTGCSSRSPPPPSLSDCVLDQAFRLEDGLQRPGYISDVSMILSPVSGQFFGYQAAQVANCAFYPSSGVIELLWNVIHVRLCGPRPGYGLAGPRTRPGRSEDKSRRTLVQMESWLGVLLQVLDAELHRTRVDDSKSSTVAASRHADFARFHSGELTDVDHGIARD